MDTLTLDLNKRYTYADYLTWFDDKRRELYAGFINIMSAPTRKHQKISMTVANYIFNFVKKKKCEIYSAPFDVRLPKNGERENDKIYTVVQPDIVVVCDPEKLDDNGCIGASDLIVEILSPGTSKNDLKDKYSLYETHGVKEYWIASPTYKFINVFILNEKSKYELKGIFVEGDKISSTTLPGLSIVIDEIFA